MNAGSLLSTLQGSSFTSRAKEVKAKIESKES